MYPVLDERSIELRDAGAEECSIGYSRGGSLGQLSASFSLILRLCRELRAHHAFDD